MTETIMREAVISFPGLGIRGIDPPASFQLFGRVIYLYGIVVAVAFLLGILYCARHSKDFGIRKDDFYDMAVWMIPLCIVGARLYYVLFNLDWYLEYPSEILKIWEGGLAIYGGILTGVLVCVLFCRRKKIRVPAMLDLCSFGLLIGQSIGRWGNFFNREAFGRETEIFCRMGLTASDGSTVYVHPTFLYESLWNLCGLILLRRFAKKRQYDGQCILLYFLWYGLGRAWIEGLRTDSLYLGQTGIRVSQLLSILLALGAAAVLLMIRGKNQKNREREG